MRFYCTKKKNRNSVIWEVSAMCFQDIGKNIKFPQKIELLTFGQCTVRQGFDWKKRH